MSKPTQTTPPDIAFSTYTRRSFIQLAVGIVIAGDIFTRDPAFADTKHQAKNPPAWLQQLTEDPHAVHRLGKTYLSTHPEERDSKRLAHKIHHAIGYGVEIDRTEVSRVVAAVKHAVRNEFLRGEVVSVDGWLLSVTEARVYALAVFLSGGG